MRYPVEPRRLWVSPLLDDEALSDWLEAEGYSPGYCIIVEDPDGTHGTLIEVMPRGPSDE